MIIFPSSASASSSAKLPLPSTARLKFEKGVIFSWLSPAVGEASRLFTFTFSRNSVEEKKEKKESSVGGEKWTRRVRSAAKKSAQSAQECPRVPVLSFLQSASLLMN